MKSHHATQHWRAQHPQQAEQHPSETQPESSTPRAQRSRLSEVCMASKFKVVLGSTEASSENTCPCYGTSVPQSILNEEAGEIGKKKSEVKRITNKGTLAPMWASDVPGGVAGGNQLIMDPNFSATGGCC